MRVPIRWTAFYVLVLSLVPGASRGGVMYEFTSIHVPGAINTWAYGINNAGQIVGQYALPGSLNSLGFVAILWAITPHSTSRGWM